MTTTRDKLSLYRDSLIIDSAHYQILIRNGADRSSIDLIGRLKEGVEPHVGGNICIQTIDYIQGMVIRLARIIIPSVFFQWLTLSASDLANHTPSPHTFLSVEVAEVLKDGRSLWNEGSQVFESVRSLLFFDSEKLMSGSTGRACYVNFIQESILSKLDDLLTEDDEQPVSLLLPLSLPFSSFSLLLPVKIRIVRVCVCACISLHLYLLFLFYSPLGLDSVS